MDKDENLDLHEVVDSYLHKLVALHEVVPHQMIMASAVLKVQPKDIKIF